MNNRNIIGIALVVVTAALTCVLASAAGEPTVRLIGKAAWYLPYVSFVGAVRCLVRA